MIDLDDSISRKCKRAWKKNIKNEFSEMNDYCPFKIEIGSKIVQAELQKLLSFFGLSGLFDWDLKSVNLEFIQNMEEESEEEESEEVKSEEEESEE